MTSRGSQNWPVVQDRPYRAHYQARPERTDTLLKLRLSVATPAKFIAPWADGQAERTCARRGEPMGGVGPPVRADRTRAINPSKAGPNRAATVPDRPDPPPAKLSQQLAYARASGLPRRHANHG